MIDRPRLDARAYHLAEQRRVPPTGLVDERTVDAFCREGDCPTGGCGGRLDEDGFCAECGRVRGRP